MIKIYVTYGKIGDPTNVHVYEAIREGNSVKIIMPKANHPGAIDFASSVGDGDISAYAVTGEVTGIDDKGLFILTNAKTTRKLTYDTETERYIWTKPKPKPKTVVDPRIVVASDYEDMSYWEYLWYSFKVSIGL